MKKNATIITTLSLVGITILSGIVLASSKVSADDSAVDTTTITVPVSCTMSSTGNHSHTAEINNGQYNSSVGETTISAFCNDNAGFTVYAIGYSGETLGNNKLISSTISDNDIVTGTAISGNTSNWAMKLSAITSPTPTFPIIIAGSESDSHKEQGDPDYSAFQQVPDDYTKVAYRTAGTDTGTNAEGSSFKTTYQVYISSNQPAGTYNGKVKYVLINPHDGTAPTIPSAFTWQPSTATRPADVDVTMMMQDFTPAMCNTGQNGQIGWVKDSRDNTVYTIAKLADGKCWMAENLDLAGGIALSASDTDITSDYISSFSTSNNLTKVGDTIVLPASSASGFDTDYYSYVYNSGNKTNCGDSGQETTCYSYYSWDATTLGSGRDIYEEDTDILYSICPKGWKLPATGERFDDGWTPYGDFYPLAIAYGTEFDYGGFIESNIFYNNAGPGTTPNFSLSGECSYGSCLGGDAGYYWSSTSGSSMGFGYYLFFNEGGVSPAMSSDYTYSYDGLSVRCILSSS